MQYCAIDLRKQMRDDMDIQAGIKVFLVTCLPQLMARRKKRSFLCRRFYIPFLLFPQSSRPGFSSILLGRSGTQSAFRCLLILCCQPHRALPVVWKSLWPNSTHQTCVRHGWGDLAFPILGMP